jgi:hypothetical protein
MHGQQSHLFEDLRLNEDKGQVNGISNGLAIAGKGTFKFTIKDDEGKQHTIHIKNSLYVPDMRRCLLLPQHWAQEAGDEQTWMELKVNGLMIAFSIGKEARKQFPTNRRPMCRYSTQPHL